MQVTGDATRAALLDAAKRLIAERGYAGTSVRDLASASGANVAAVNYHYGSRERLLTQAVLESFLDWTDRVSRVAAADREAGPLEQLLSSLAAMLDELPEHEALFATFLEALLQARRSPQLHGQLAEHYAEQRRRVGDMVRTGAGTERVSTHMVEVLSALLIAVADGLLVQSLLDSRAVPSSDELAALARGFANVGGRKRGSACEAG